MAWSIEQLFPDCYLPTCPQHGKKHQHILPHQEELFSATEKYIYWQGGVGSAKTTAIAVYFVLMHILIEDNVGIVFRLDLKLLSKSSWLAIKEVNDRVKDIGVFKKSDWLTKDHPCKMEDKNQIDYTKIIYPNGSIAYAGQTKKLSEGLGPEYGIFWIDDAYESSSDIFYGDETNAGMVSRLRLPRVAHATFNGQPRSMLKGIVSSNPPPGNHWLIEVFGKTPGVRAFGDSQYRFIRSDTLQNPNLPPEYVSEIMRNHTKEDARRILRGETVITYGGKPVYPQFKKGIHISDPEYDPHIPLIRSWDFGYNHPAVLFNQIPRCEAGKNHYTTLAEVVNCFDCSVQELYEEVDEQTKLLFPEASPRRLLEAGDRAGYKKNAANKDKRGEIRILKEEPYNLTFRYKYLHIDPSLDYIRGLLRKTCECGEPVITIHRRCQGLIEALDGGYRYTRKRDGTYSDLPYKDKYFDDIADAYRYGPENYFKHVNLSTPPPQKLPQNGNRTPWGWMEVESVL